MEIRSSHESRLWCDESRVRPALSEVERLQGDNARARELLEWTPAYTGLGGLRRGLAETVSWYRDPAHLRRYKTDMYNV